jgi:hypothetical protein
MSDDEFEARVTRREPVPLPDANDDAAAALGRPEPVRTPRARPDSFRTSEACVAGQIACAVARGQRVL